MAIRIPIISDFDDRGLARATRQFKELETAGQKAQFAIQKAAAPAALALGGLAVGAYKAIEAGSDLAESQAKVGQIFGQSSIEIEKFAATAAQQLGQSEQDVLNAAGVFGTFGKAAGLAGNDLAQFSNGFTALATDLASFNNTTPEEAVEAIGAALRGESEPLRKYGVLLDDATLRAEALKLGIYDGNGALTAQQKILAAQSAIYKQTKDAQGDFARTSGGLANQQRILKAEMANFATTIGQALLPIIQALLPVLGDFASWIANNTPLVIGIGVAIGSVALAITTANAAMAAWNVITKVTAALNAILGTSFSALWVATGVGIIVAIIAAVVALQAKFKLFTPVIDALKAGFQAVWSVASQVFQWISDKIGMVSSFFAEAFRIAFGVITGYFNAWWAVVSGMATKIGQIFTTLATAITNTIKGIIQGFITAFVGAINALIGLINKAIKNFNKIPLVPNLPTVPTLSVPQLAEGGIVTSPTLAMIGEAGPEAVIPLDRLNQGITVNIAGSVTSERDLIETIRRGLVNAQRNGAQLVYSNT
jgi:type III secretory pathway component EscS